MIIINIKFSTVYILLFTFIIIIAVILILMNNKVKGINRLFRDYEKKLEVSSEKAETAYILFNTIQKRLKEIAKKKNKSVKKIVKAVNDSANVCKAMMKSNINRKKRKKTLKIKEKEDEVIEAEDIEFEDIEFE